MFIGREKELSELKEQFSSDQKTAVLVYGKRRVGKSTLICEASRDFDGTVINYLCIKSSFSGNLEVLSKSITEAFDLPKMRFESIFDLFDFLGKQNSKILLVLDEYQYLKESLKEKEMDSYMQAVVDRLATNVKLVLCGSYISVMKELLEESDPLFGRFTKILRIEEFDYKDAALFYPELSVRDKIRFYSVFGGSPYVLSSLDYKKTLEENIVALLINQNSLLRSYIENIMLKEIQKAYDVRILECLGNGKKRYREISQRISSSDTGLLDKQLKNLMAMETVVKVFPINKSNDKKKVFYEIKDNLLRFYFSFVFANESRILKFGEVEFFKRFIAPSLNTFISLRFEDIACQYFKRRVRSGKMADVEDFGTFWYDDVKTGTNGQFDCVLKEPDGYAFFEVKFYDHKMALSECEKEENQVLQIPNLPCKRIGFVCSSGFDFESQKYHLITGEDIYR